MASLKSKLLDNLSILPRPQTPAPEDNKARSDLAKAQLRNFKATSMVSNSVNKTALHPGGVQYVLSD
jgi:hypothetical protein